MQVWCQQYHNKNRNAAPARENPAGAAYLIKKSAVGGTLQ